MNKRIKELAGETLDHAMPQTWCSVSPDELDRILEKFAELIVSECVKVAMRSVSDDEPKEAWYLIQEHFGVEE